MSGDEDHSVSNFRADQTLRRRDAQTQPFRRGRVVGSDHARVVSAISRLGSLPSGKSGSALLTVNSYIAIFQSIF